MVRGKSQWNANRKTPNLTVSYVELDDGSSFASRNFEPRLNPSSPERSSSPEIQIPLMKESSKIKITSASNRALKVNVLPSI